jgi:hypothetical protein
MKKVLLVLLAGALLILPALSCSGGGAKSVAIKDILSNPHQWEGKQVTIEGDPFAGIGKSFQVWGEDGSYIQVESESPFPDPLVYKNVRVTGVVYIGRPGSWTEYPYILAQSWKYIN